MRILLDVDYCIAPLHDEWLSRYNRDFDDNLQSWQITEWDMTKFVSPKCGVGIYKYLNDMDLYDTLSPVTGSIWAVETLLRLGHDVRFVTSGVNVSKINFLRKWGFVRSEQDFVIAADKSLIIGDVLVDDYEKNLDTFNGFTILFDAAHNRHDTKHTRAIDWWDVVAYITLYESKIQRS